MPSSDAPHEYDMTFLTNMQADESDEDDDDDEDADSRDSEFEEERPRSQSNRQPTPITHADETD